MIKQIFNKILSLIYPQKCKFCSKVISSEQTLCNECKSALKPIYNIKKLEYLPGKSVVCISLFKYVGIIREGIHKFKFCNYKELSNYFICNVSRNDIKNLIKSKIDYITCVPLSRERLNSRGYNQSECFARNLSEIIDVPYKDILIKNADNAPQHKLSASERALNVLDMYKVIDCSEIKGKNILICDDIVTTGSTLKECVKILKSGKSNNIFCFTIAYI